MDQRSSSTKLSTDEQLIMVIPETQLSDNTQHVPPPLNAELAIAHKSAENDFPPTHTHTHTHTKCRDGAMDCHIYDIMPAMYTLLHAIPTPCLSIFWHCHPCIAVHFL